MTRTPVSSLIVVMLAAGAASAQSDLPISVDQRVRVATADAVYIGRVAAVDPDVRLTVDGREPLVVPRAAVTRIERSRGISRSSAARKGAIRGAIIAGVLGALSLGLQHESIGDGGSSAGQAAALGAFSGGLFGGLIGAGIGASRAGERWEQVWP